MTDGKQDKYAAVDASLGYLYQVRSALLWTLKRMKSEPDFLVGIETLDDVAFETVGGDPRELLQTKHHRSATASLTDASTDLWKTLRIWFEGTASGEIPATASMCLVTTGEASAGSAASCLHGNNRDVQAAVTRLNATQRDRAVFDQRRQQASLRCLLGRRSDRARCTAGARHCPRRGSNR